MLVLTPIGQRRWNRFKQNRRGWWSLWVFLTLTILCLCSEMIANDKPLVMSVKGELFFPAFVSYTEQEVGGQLPFEPDYKSRYVKNLVEKEGGWMMFAPVSFSFDTVNYDLAVPTPSAPSTENWLGTDDQARDVFARVIYGLRVSIVFALAITLISSVIGIAAGAIQGYFGGWVDLGGQRLLEVWAGLPVFFMLIILSGFIEPGFWSMLGIVAVFTWTALVEVVRAEFLRGRGLEYVKAARALGLSNRTIMYRHIFPNALTAVVSFLPFVATGTIGALSALDFLGLGMPSGSPSMGELIAQARDNLQAPWLALTAFVAMAMLLSLLVFIGEALRDAFDPRS
ncbi:ABC transporter permease [Pseudomonas putida]|uniref:ABC transporter permease n=1 Tax=Pseudomonas putida TaxID=303 RepID=UPI0009A1559D|nr:ABC transporter permease [Pseudomonas putida]